MYTKQVQKLIDSFSKFPGVGPKTAARFVFHLLESPTSEIEGLTEDIAILKKSLSQCKLCFKFFNSPEKQAQKELCEICSNQRRKRGVLCVVEKETDLVSIEKNRFYKGLYFILGGTISSMKEEEINALRIEELEQRIKNPQNWGVEGRVSEVILALNPTIEGESTALYIERKLKDLDIKITRLGCGLPRGGEVEYADKQTLLSAFKHRGKA